MPVPLSDAGRIMLLDAVNLLERAAKRRIDDPQATGAFRTRQDIKMAIDLLRPAQGWVLTLSGPSLTRSKRSAKAGQFRPSAGARGRPKRSTNEKAK
jgi:hypothetical protein